MWPEVWANPKTGSQVVMELTLGVALTGPPKGKGLALPVSQSKTCSQNRTGGALQWAYPKPMHKKYTVWPCE